MTSNQNPSIYYAQWTDCYTVFDGKDMAYLFFDLGLYRMIPIVGKDDTLQILVNYISPKDDGLPEKMDINNFNSMGQKLYDILSKEFEISYIGYLASNGVCGFYFCAKASNNQKSFIDEVMISFSEYEYAVYLIENDCWNAYTGCFFPAYQTSELIQNGMVVARFEKDGDTLVTPRPVYHGFRFRTQSDRESFIAVVREEGFHVDSISENTLENKDAPFRLELSRTDTIDRKSVNECTSYLWKIAYQHFGICEGWYAQGFHE